MIAIIIFAILAIIFLACVSSLFLFSGAKILKFRNISIKKTFIANCSGLLLFCLIPGILSLMSGLLVLPGLLAGGIVWFYCIHRIFKGNGFFKISAATVAGMLPFILFPVCVLGYAAYLDQKINFLHKSGEYEASLALSQKIKNKMTPILGEDSPLMAPVLGKIAMNHYSLGNYKEAEINYRKAIELAENNLDESHKQLAKLYNNFGILNLNQGNYNRANELLEKALKIKESNFGENHASVANTLINIASANKNLAEYKQAEKSLQRALSILTASFGENHSESVKVIGNMASLHQETGAYDKAEKLYQKALKINEKAYGPDHPDNAYLLNGLAGVYEESGAYEKVEPVLQRALAIQKKSLGSEHLLISATTTQLADYYAFIGEKEKTRKLLTEVLETNKRIMGENHLLVAADYVNLAMRTEDNKAAEEYYLKALEIYKKNYEKDHPKIAAVYSALSGFYERQNEHEKALAAGLQALEILENKFGNTHPEIYGPLTNLGAIYTSLDQFDKAVSVLQRAVTIIETSFGPDSPKMTEPLQNLGFAYVKKKAYADARPYLQRVFAIEQALIKKTAGFTSDTQKLTFLSTTRKKFDLYLNLLIRCLDHDPSKINEAFEGWLGRKGIVLEAQKQYQEALLYADDRPEIQELNQRLSAVRTQLSRLVFSGPGEESAEVHRKKLESIQKKKEALEAQLSRISHEFALSRKKVEANSEMLAQKLPAETALVEFIKLSHIDFNNISEAKDTLDKGESLPQNYFAFVLHAGRPDDVRLIDLSDAARIDEKIAALKKAILTSEQTELPSAKTLYNLVFAPIQKELGGAKTLFISPDGNLNLIPFEVMQSPDGRYLIEDYTFNYLAAGRDIAAFGETTHQNTGKALLIGNPDFNLAPGEKPALLAALKERNEENSPLLRGPQNKSTLKPFASLPQTGKEVESIRELLGKEASDLYTGKAALEEVLFAAKSPSILHLATHGFFLQDVEISVAGNLRGVGGVYKNGSHSPSPEMNLRKIENPLLRSGIALAGANRALKSENPDASNGLVTAEKILGMRLKGTEMVVLSACETGLGDVQTGEGVFGLRRAFTQAGARSLVMSMWSVPDESTRLLMVKFYENILSGKMNRCQALRQAVLDRMAQLKEQYGAAAPFLWGAFVFMGES